MIIVLLQLIIYLVKKNTKGHYTTDVLCSDEQQWIRYNNDNKYKIDFIPDIMMSEDIKRDVTMLIYEKFNKKLIMVTEKRNDSFLSCPMVRMEWRTRKKQGRRNKTHYQVKKRLIQK